MLNYYINDKCILVDNFQNDFILIVKTITCTSVQS